MDSSLGLSLANAFLCFHKQILNKINVCINKILNLYITQDK